MDYVEKYLKNCNINMVFYLKQITYLFHANFPYQKTRGLGFVMFSRGMDMENWLEVSVKFFFLLWETFFWLTIAEFHLRETSNELIYMKVASYFYESFSLIFFKFWLQIAQCSTGDYYIIDMLYHCVWYGSLLQLVELPIFKNEEANLLKFENPCLPLHHHLFPINHKTHCLW